MKIHKVKITASTKAGLISTELMFSRKEWQEFKQECTEGWNIK